MGMLLSMTPWGMIDEYRVRGMYVDGGGLFMTNSGLQTRLGEILLENGKISRNDLDRALEVQKTVGGLIGLLLIKLGVVSEVDVYLAISRQTGLDLVREDRFIKDKPNMGELNPNFLFRYSILPLTEKSDDELSPSFVSSYPQSEALRRALNLVYGVVPLIQLGLDSEIQKKLSEWLLEAEQDAPNEATYQADEFIEHLRDLASEAPIIQKVNQILAQAVAAQASDIHLETYENKSVVRIRVDGEMYAIDEIDGNDAPAIVSRIKIIAQLDIAERRLPQDGRTKLRIHGKEMDARVSTMPTMFGESVVLRLLERNFDLLSLDRLNFDAEKLASLKRLIALPHGIILVTGPTGSGKSTTLYASLQELKGDSLKILTVEDPVEYRLQWLNQVQVQPQIGLTFAKVLRSFLRQDPDVIMIGEMRDGETAEIAVQAALTGHLVVSTLHTNNALGAVVRLINMGVEPYLITASLMGVLAQRLVRQLCNECKVPASENQAMLAAQSLGVSVGGEDTICQPVGCAACRGTGYKGRLAIHELLVLTDDMKSKIVERGASLRKNEGVYVGGNLQHDGALKFLQGLTTAEEVLRVAREDD